MTVSDIQQWCDHDKGTLAEHSKVVDYVVAFGLHVLGATADKWGKTSPHGAGYTPVDRRTLGHYAPRQNPAGSFLGHSKASIG